LWSRGPRQGVGGGELGRPVKKTGAMTFCYKGAKKQPRKMKPAAGANKWLLRKPLQGKRGEMSRVRSRGETGQGECQR